MFRWTLSRELGVFLLAQVGVLVFVYSQLLPQYLWSGIHEASEIFVKSEARAASAYIEEYGILPSTQGRSIQLYRQPEDMPEAIRTLVEESGKPPVPDRVYLRPRGDSGILFLMRDLGDGQRLFAVFQANEEVLRSPGGPFDEFTELLRLRERVGLGFLALWGVLTALLLRRIYVRTKRMSLWTQGLASSGASRDDPRFGYGEFDDVGRELQGAFARVSRSLERESEFVRNASHELRTPIAIIRSNLDLERKRSGAESDALGRIRRASGRMQQLVDTLLWLSREERDNNDEPTAEDVDLEAMVRQIADEHADLLQGTGYEIQTVGSLNSLRLAEQPARIALDNLIRNAFQHGDGGEIGIRLTGESVTVTNRVEGQSGDVSTATSDGLGLTLVKKITQRMGWAFRTSSQDTLHTAELRFGAI